MVMQAPLIGIVPSYVPEEDILRLKFNYCQAIEQWGGMPLVLPMTDDLRLYEYLLPQMDGFLFTGGHDISPECYGEISHTDKLSPLTPNRDRMESRILNYAYDYDIPVLGVCRGMQMINVHFGGTLYQDLAEDFHSLAGAKWALEGIYVPDEQTDDAQSDSLDINQIERMFCPGCLLYGREEESCIEDRFNMAHTMEESGVMQSSAATRLQHWQQDHYHCPSHFVKIDPHSHLGQILETDYLAVNSMHHQGIKEVAPNLRAVARATDGLVEAIEMPDRLFFMGTQWHPEFFPVRMGLLFKAFVDASRIRFGERLESGMTCRADTTFTFEVRD